MSTFAFLVLFFFASLSCTHATHPNKPYNWSVVAVFKNESMILPEWIQHYINEGADHLYLIDNGSEDDYMTSLIRLPQQQMITLIRDSTPHQRGLQDMLMKRYATPWIKEKSQWALVVDIDEYVYPSGTERCIADVLASYPEEIGRIWLPWKIFGSNGHLTQPPEGIVAGFTKRRGVDHSMAVPFLGYGKSFTRMSDTVELLTHFSGNDSRAYHFSNGSHVVYGKQHANVTLEEAYSHRQSLQLNHYMFQSRDYYERVKCVRGGGQSGLIGKYTMKYFLHAEPHHNSIEDTDLMRRNEVLGKSCMSKFAV